MELDVVTRLLMENNGISAVRYTENLTIVGGNHSLSKRDEELLEELIDEHDFVAVELDHFRVDGERYNIGSGRRGYDAQSRQYFVSHWDWFFIQNFLKVNDHTIKRRNQYLIEQGSPSRDVNRCELSFCYKKAIEKGKDAYLVDIPVYETFDKLLALPKITQLHLLAVRRLTDTIIPAAVDILFTQRERHMLQEIVDKEGSLDDLPRKGLLVVGGKHAFNYLQNPWPLYLSN